MCVRVCMPAYICTAACVYSTLWTSDIIKSLGIQDAS